MTVFLTVNGGEYTSPMSFLSLQVRKTCPGDIGDIILETLGTSCFKII